MAIPISYKLSHKTLYFKTWTFLHFISYFCYTNALTQRRFHCQTISHTKAFAHSFYTQRPLHKKSFRHIFLHTLFDTKAFTHRSFRSFRSFQRQKMLLTFSPTLYQAFQTCSRTFLETDKNLTAQKFPTFFGKLSGTLLNLTCLTVHQSFRNLRRIFFQKPFKSIQTLRQAKDGEMDTWNGFIFWLWWSIRIICCTGICHCILGLLGQILEHFTFEKGKLCFWLKPYNYCPLEIFGCYCQIRLRRSLFLEFGKFIFKNLFLGMSIAGCSFVEKIVLLVLCSE